MDEASDPTTKARFKDHFSEAAAGYARHRPVYPPALADFLAESTPRRELAWDCGCGSGQLSLLLADRFERVVATDASPQQLAKAARHPQVEYRCAPAEASGLASATVDLAVAAQAAHWFDLEHYYAEVRRVARPGAIVALVTYGIGVVDEPIGAVFRHFYFEVLDTYWPPERAHVEDGYRSFAFPFEEIAAPPLEMRASWTLADLIGYAETWSAVWALQKAEGRKRIDAFRSALTQAWGEPETVRAIRWPLSLRVGRVRDRLERATS